MNRSEQIEQRQAAIESRKACIQTNPAHTDTACTHVPDMGLNVSKIHLGVAKTALEIAHRKAVFDPSNDRCEKLAVDHPELCTAVLLAADGDNSGLRSLHTNAPDLFEYVFHKVRSLTAQYDAKMADIAQSYLEQANTPNTQDSRKNEPFIESPPHTCGGYSLEKGKPNSDLITTFYKTGKVKKKRKFHSKRLWRTCAGCAHDRVLREVPKIQDEQKLYKLFYTVLSLNDYRKLVSRFTTWRSRAVAAWHKAIAETPKDAALPKPPHDIVYIGYRVSGGVVVVHNQTSLARRGKNNFELVPMPTEKRPIYDLIGEWVADAPADDTRKFIMGSQGFGGKFAGTRAVQKESPDSSQNKEMGSIKFKFVTCSALTEKKIDRLLNIQEANRYGLGKTELSVQAFRDELKAQGIEHEIMGGEAVYKKFVTQCGVMNAKPNDDKLCHKLKNDSASRDAKSEAKQAKLFQENLLELKTNLS